MPTYEYECTKCGYNFEVFQAMSDEPLKTCTKCGKEVRRLILGGAGVIFKGSGFYVTDKGKGKGPPSGGKGAKASGAESKTTESSGTSQNAASSGGAASTSKTAADKPAAQTT
jgi:putative FmdB family regulatory protein